MPAKRKTVKTKKKISDDKIMSPVAMPKTSAVSSTWRSPKNFILLAILLAGLLFWKFKGSLIAAMVNGQPISRMELDNQLTKRFGNQLLDNIINERLILAAARQKGVFVTSDEIDARINQIQSQMQSGTSLDDALKLQGITKNDLRHQIEIQISIEKMFSKDASVSASEIDQYIEGNPDYKNATDPAKVRSDVTNILKQQKISDQFDKWFTEVRKNAKIQKFI